jgi:hypothetical protein
MEQDKTNGHMRNGAALARKPVTSIAERCDELFTIFDEQIRFHMSDG